jgi:hypothetical protein
MVGRTWDRFRMTRYADYATDGTTLGRCVVLPGSKYTPDGPMLFFAAQVALMQGWDVRQVWWEVPRYSSEADEVAWVGAQLEAAVDGYTGRVVVVAKSLGTLAASAAAAHGYDAAWLTPLLTEPDLAEPLLSYPAAQLVVIGPRTPTSTRTCSMRSRATAWWWPVTTSCGSPATLQPWSPATTPSSGRSTRGWPG